MSTSPAPAATRTVQLANGQSLTLKELRTRVEAAGALNLNDIKFVEVLLTRNFLHPDALDDFVAGATRANVDVASYALSRNLVTENDIAGLRALINRVGRIDLEKIPIDPQTTELIDAFQAQRLGAIPVGRRGDGRIVVAVADPSDVALQDELPLLVQAPVELRVTTISQLRQFMNDLYRPTERAAGEMTQPMTITEDFRVGATEADSTIISLVHQIILRAQTEGASDIHLEPGDGEAHIRMRIDGLLREIQTLPVPVHEQVASRVKVMSDMKIDERRLPQDGRASVDVGRGEIDLRIATLPTLYGEQVSIRLLDPATSRLSLPQLGLAEGNLEQLQASMSRPWGAIIITGPTGSGKSTTLYSVLNVLNERTRKIITVEDPVEQRIPGVQQVNASEGGRLNFASSLRSILRNDPDVIMIGEIRDHETAKISIESALTGHLVLSSLHTNDAASAITRLMEMGVEPFLIANAIELIVAQRLVRRLCEVCRREFEVDAEYLNAIHAPAWAIERAEREGKLVLYRPSESGCGNCRGRGYRGRTGTHEALHMDEDMKIALVAQGATAEEIGQMARDHGMTTLRDDCFAKVVNGVTSLEELARVVV